MVLVFGLLKMVPAASNRGCVLGDADESYSCEIFRRVCCFERDSDLDNMDSNP